MSSIEVSIDLPSNVDDVWDAISDLERHTEWMTDAETITFVGDQRSGVGTTMDVLTRVGPLTTVDRIVVEEWSPPTTIAVTHRGIISGEGAFHLTPTSQGTRFAWTERLSFPWYLGGGVTANVAKPVLRRIWRSNLERFSATLPAVAPTAED